MQTHLVPKIMHQNLAINLQQFNTEQIVLLYFPRLRNFLNLFFFKTRVLGLLVKDTTAQCSLPRAIPYLFLTFVYLVQLGTKMPRSIFKLRISGVGIDHSSNCASVVNLIKQFTIINYDSRVVNYDRRMVYKIGLR